MIAQNMSFLGNGIRFPLRRVGGDYESSSGEDLVLSHIAYILLTNADGPDGQGEQPWDTKFGSQLRRLKFSGLSGDALRQYVDEFVVDALARNEPRVVVTDVQVSKRRVRGGNRVDINIFVSMIDKDTDSNEVFLQPDAKIALSLPY